MQEHRFDEAFWANVHQRVASVRGLAMTELDNAENLLLAEASESVTAADANVVPVFTEPFWEEVGQRTGRVRQMALSSVAEAEERLVGQDLDIETVTVRHAHHAPTGLRAFSRTFSFQRSDAFGFAAALLAVVLLVPQLIAPVMSSAGVEPPRIVQFLIIGDESAKPHSPRPLAGEAGSSSEPEKPEVSASSGDFPRPKASAPSGSNAVAGSDAASGGTTGTPGAAVEGTPVPGQNGGGNAGTAAVSPAPQASPESSPIPPKVPLAPAGLEATAIDSTTIRLSWIDNSTDETAFQINRTGVEAPVPAFRSVGRDVTTYLWIDVAPQTQACFRIRASGEAQSDWAPAGFPGQVCATTPATPADAAAAQPQAPPGPQPAAAAP